MLTIVVCVKLVPDVAEVRIDPVHHTLMRQGVDGMLNPFDEFAVEEGIRIKETSGGEVVAISMGPPVAEKGSAAVRTTSRSAPSARAMRSASARTRSGRIRRSRRPGC